MKILKFLKSEIKVKTDWSDLTLLEFEFLADPPPELELPEVYANAVLQLIVFCHLTFDQIAEMKVTDVQSLLELVTPHLAFISTEPKVEPVAKFSLLLDWENTGLAYVKHFSMADDYANEPFGKYLQTCKFENDYAEASKEGYTFALRCSRLATVTNEVRPNTLFENIKGKKDKEIYSTQNIPIFSKAFMHLPVDTFLSAEAFFLQQYNGFKKDMLQSLIALKEEEIQKKRLQKHMA